jgi:hypothetical protein
MMMVTTVPRRHARVIRRHRCAVIRVRRVSLGASPNLVSVSGVNLVAIVVTSAASLTPAHIGPVLAGSGRVLKPILPANVPVYGFPGTSCSWSDILRLCALVFLVCAGSCLVPICVLRTARLGMLPRPERVGKHLCCICILCTVMQSVAGHAHVIVHDDAAALAASTGPPE